MAVLQIGSGPGTEDQQNDHGRKPCLNSHLSKQRVIMLAAILHCLLKELNEIIHFRSLIKKINASFFNLLYRREFGRSVKFILTYA